MDNDLDYEGIEFPVSEKKIIGELNRRRIFASIYSATKIV